MVSRHCTRCQIELWSLDPHEYCIRHRPCILKHQLYWKRAGCSHCLGVLENPVMSPMVDYIKKNILSWREENKILSDDVFLPISKKTYAIPEKALEFPKEGEISTLVPVDTGLPETNQSTLVPVDTGLPETKQSTLVPEDTVLPENNLSTPGIEQVPVPTYFADLAKQLLTKMEDRFRDIEEKHKTSFNVQSHPEKANSYFQKILGPSYSSHSSPPHQSERTEFHAYESPLHSERHHLKKHVHFSDNEETEKDRSILPSDNFNHFDFAKRGEEFPPIIDQSKPDQFKFSSEWNKAMGVIRVFHPKVQEPIPVDRVEGTDYQFNISDQSASFISETISNLRVSQTENRSTCNYKPLLNTSRIQFYHDSIPELSDFLSKRKQHSDLKKYIPYAHPASDTLQICDINIDIVERQHAANAILQLDMMRTMTSLLESRAKNQEDQEFLSAFCNLALTNAESMTSYALAQTVSRRSRMRTDVCKDPVPAQLSLLKANIISRDLFPQQVIDEVGKRFGNKLIMFHSRSISIKRKKSSTFLQQKRTVRNFSHQKNPFRGSRKQKNHKQFPENVRTSEI